MDEATGGNLSHLFFMKTRAWATLEPCTRQIINDFKSRKMKVIALTALFPIIVKSFKINTVDWRIQHLLSLGYDFSKSILVPSFYGFSGANFQNPIEPYFKDGIIFSGFTPKGIALRDFLYALSYKPKKVLFVDDSISYIHSVYRELTRIGIECDCVYYTRTRKYSITQMFSRNTYLRQLKVQERFLEEFDSKNFQEQLNIVSASPVTSSTSLSLGLEAEVKGEKDLVTRIQEKKTIEEVRGIFYNYNYLSIKPRLRIYKDLFYFQRAQQYYLGERIYVTSEMRSINYMLQRRSRDFGV